MGDPGNANEDGEDDASDEDDETRGDRWGSVDGSSFDFWGCRLNALTGARGLTGVRGLTGGDVGSEVGERFPASGVVGNGRINTGFEMLLSLLLSMGRGAGPTRLGLVGGEAGAMLPGTVP